jgi:hypothetical protein
MPKKKDPVGGGTNADGTRSEMFCSYCYQNGDFVNPDWTAEQMQEFCKNKLKEMRFPEFVAKFLVKGIPNLKRWKR